MSDKKPIYKGFSFFEYERTKSFIITDIELVKLDLLNHIFTSKGARYRQVDFGSVIPDIVFEPGDEDTIEQIYEDLERVFNFDPRVELLKLEVQPNLTENAITVSALLRYVELDFVDTFDLNIST